MADVTFSPSNGSESVFGRLLHALRQLKDGIQDGLKAYQRFQILSAMGDRTLADMGLKREDIAHEAMFPTKWRAL